MKDLTKKELLEVEGGFWGFIIAATVFLAIAVTVILTAEPLSDDEWKYLEDCEKKYGKPK